MFALNAFIALILLEQFHFSDGWFAALAIIVFGRVLYGVLF
jgi:hypothetical protein